AAQELNRLGPLTGARVGLRERAYQVRFVRNIGEALLKHLDRAVWHAARHVTSDDREVAVCILGIELERELPRRVRIVQAASEEVSAPGPGVDHRGGWFQLLRPPRLQRRFLEPLHSVKVHRIPDATYAVIRVKLDGAP